MRLLLPAKAEAPRDVTDEGMLTVGQLIAAECIRSDGNHRRGNVSLRSADWMLNAFAPMEVTEVGMNSSLLVVNSARWVFPSSNNSIMRLLTFASDRRYGS